MKLKKSNATLLFLSLVAFSAKSFAGGMSSAGEVTFKPIIICDVEAFDPTFPAETVRAEFTKETGYDGDILWELQSFTMITYNQDNEIIRYYPLQEDASFEYLERFPESVEIFQYRPGTEDNTTLGIVTFDDTESHQTDGQVISESNEMESFLLKSCTWVAESQN